ncbi:polysaccharide lyase family 3 [Colletotrichum scovillei]|uniref:Pectate lyase n=1 Tax=Colletotrichum scovillei TaxID=1209932 RepID=A0A9P7QVW1_9PEZI|nr:polysaccharide lyase family 3 [Colletotrichum scovillei]KAF4778798.1 polysaccharide lyase family 3 [Colletotrichum scovillei]KAG7039843.1 polysaccharide lyase family 3 [Colletotrichum scovillei]KAG7042018.1 polysaccharide lyase family 3 [Colletotrichum scovillei]KAG7062049.1 polysaccharide lyase family 3 [Colletotrichum scovillei]
MLSKIVVLTGTLLGALPMTLACLGYEGGLPKPTSNKQISAPIYVKSGEVFDGGWAKYDRNPTSCREQVEGGEKDTAFVLQKGATLRNVIIGKTAGEGVYCLGGGCNIEFVWFEDVCEDAISIKNDKAGDVTWIVGGGAYHAADKIIQHNGCGRVNIINFYANDYGKVYRSCGTCEKCAREVYIEGVTARNGGEVAGITKANGDKATLVNVCTDAKTPCQNYSGPGVKDGPC